MSKVLGNVCGWVLKGCKWSVLMKRCLVDGGGCSWGWGDGSVKRFGGGVMESCG